MASILDKYGIKEVFDFTMYEIGEGGAPKKPVLYSDTLKVSTTEQTAEENEARGGKGNAVLLSWDTNKDITVDIEDALFSAKSMAIMFGDGTVRDYKTVGDNAAYIMKTEIFTAAATVAPPVPTGDNDTTVYGTTNEHASGWQPYYVQPGGKFYKKVNPKFYTAKGAVVLDNAEKQEEGMKEGEDKDYVIGFKKDDKYFCSYDLKIDGSVIDVSATTFPGTYYCTGDSYARNATTGQDDFLQLVFPKAKVTSENTIAMEADGDPSTFSMQLKLLRPDDGVMMKIVKYDLVDDSDVKPAESNLYYHNHYLDIQNVDEPKTASLSAVSGSPVATAPKTTSRVID